MALSNKQLEVIINYLYFKLFNEKIKVLFDFYNLLNKM